MKPTLLFTALLAALTAFSQQYEKDESEAFSAIKNYAFKRGYQYDVAFKNKRDAAIYVKSNTDYVIFCVYDNSNRPVATYTAYLMTPEKKTRDQYTAKPQDVGVFKSAGGYMFNFTTPVFVKATKYPVKLEGNLNSNFYVFYRNRKVTTAKPR